ncbi:MAG: SDR family NAD(P)-dependent oxidoreductase, partial [Paracoccaceae bacterium]
MLASLKDRSVIVTGGSKGIGRGIARVFARAGGKLTVVGRDKAALDAVVAEMQAEGAASVRSAICDVSDFASVQKMVDEAAAAQGGL